MIVIAQNKPACVKHLTHVSTIGAVWLAWLPAALGSVCVEGLNNEQATSFYRHCCAGAFSSEPRGCRFRRSLCPIGYFFGQKYSCVPDIEAAAYWTPARLLNTKLMKPSPSTRWAPTQTTLDLITPSIAAPGSPPIEAAAPSLAEEVLPGGGTAQAPTEDQVSPTDDLGHGLFTESRVFPVPAQTAQYPYPASTVGAFFGHDPRTGGNFRCSASVLRPRIILTAGHCVVKPSTSSSGRYFYSNFL